MLAIHRHTHMCMTPQFQEVPKHHPLALGSKHPVKGYRDLSRREADIEPSFLYALHFFFFFIFQPSFLPSGPFFCLLSLRSYPISSAPRFQLIDLTYDPFAQFQCHKKGEIIPGTGSEIHYPPCARLGQSGKEVQVT